MKTMTKQGTPTMRPLILIGLLLVTGSLLWATCGDNSTATVRKTIEDAAKAVESGLNNRNLDKVEGFFATAAEGANPAGLEETWGALQRFMAGLTSSDRVQFHSFAVKEVTVHESGGLARATYRMHLSVLRGSEVIFGFVAVQDLALSKTPRGWRISGGDTPQLSEVVGQWPPRN